MDECFAPIAVIGRRVNEVKQEILEQKGIAVKHVIMTSDEKNPAWWQAVLREGWYRVDSSETVERHGAWSVVIKGFSLR